MRRRNVLIQSRRANNACLLWLFSLVSIVVPATRFFWLKRNILRLAGCQISREVKFASGVRVASTGAVIIGERSWIGYDCLMVGGSEGSIKIGADCDIAPRVSFLTGTHEIDINGHRVAGRGLSKPIIVQDGCWLCAGSIILGGTVIGNRSIVAAGSVVKGEFPQNSFIGGVPGKRLGTVSEYLDD